MVQNFMKEKKILPLVISMSLPMVISMAVNSLYNIVDSYWRRIWCGIECKNRFLSGCQ